MAFSLKFIVTFVSKQIPNAAVCPLTKTKDTQGIEVLETLHCLLTWCDYSLTFPVDLYIFEMLFFN